MEEEGSGAWISFVCLRALGGCRFFWLATKGTRARWTCQKQKAPISRSLIPVMVQLEYVMCYPCMSIVFRAQFMTLVWGDLSLYFLPELLRSCERRMDPTGIKPAPSP